MKVDTAVREVVDSFHTLTNNIPHGFPHIRDRQFYTAFYLRMGTEFDDRVRLHREIRKGFREVFTQSCAQYTAEVLKRISDKMWETEATLDTLYDNLRKSQMRLQVRQREDARIEEAYKSGEMNWYDYDKACKDRRSHEGITYEQIAVNHDVRKIKEELNRIIIWKRELAYFRGETWHVSYNTEDGSISFWLDQLNDYFNYREMDEEDEDYCESAKLRILRELEEHFNLTELRWDALHERLAELKAELTKKYFTLA